MRWYVGFDRLIASGSACSMAGKIVAGCNCLILHVFTEPPVEVKQTTNEKKVSSNAFKGNGKSNPKSHSERVKVASEEKRSAPEKLESKSQSKKNYDSSKPYGKFDPPERRNHPEKKIEFGKFESKKNFDNNPRTDKSFGNFKYNKYDQKNGNADFSSKSELFKNKSNEKRSQNNVNPSAIKTYNRSFDINEYKKQVGFIPMNEKPPRFQKYQNQQSENQVSNIQSWSDQSYNRMPQNEYQLQNSLANLTLQQNLVNFQNQNSQDAYGDILQGKPMSLTFLPELATGQRPVSFRCLVGEHQAEQHVLSERGFTDITIRRLKNVWEPEQSAARGAPSVPHELLR